MKESVLFAMRELKKDWLMDQEGLIVSSECCGALLF